MIAAFSARGGPAAAPCTARSLQLVQDMVSALQGLPDRVSRRQRQSSHNCSVNEGTPRFMQRATDVSSNDRVCSLLCAGCNRHRHPQARLREAAGCSWYVRTLARDKLQRQECWGHALVVDWPFRGKLGQDAVHLSGPWVNSYFYYSFSLFFATKPLNLRGGSLLSCRPHS